nr:hypothetical protein [Asgard group archaeon]
MNTKYNFKKVILLAILMSFSIIPLLSTEKIHAEEMEPFFYIDILCPNTLPTRTTIASLLIEELPKIGIGVDTFDLTGWSQIIPRTYGYPGPYPIPNYDLGGYDLVFITWTRDFDFNPLGLYDTPSITPDGDNFYQYSNPTMDAALNNYVDSITLEDRLKYAKEIQELLYEDLPAIGIHSSSYLYLYNENLTIQDCNLWANDYQSMENWELGGKNNLSYATPAEFGEFNIYQCGDNDYDSMWLNQIYCGLLKRIPDSPYNNTYGPNLVTSYSTTDGLTYNIQLNPDVKWADGQVLNASDVKFSYDLMPILSFNPNLAYWSSLLDEDSVNIINEFELEITFNSQYFFQDNNLGLDLIPKHIWGEIDPADFITQTNTWVLTDPTKLLGAGPYYLQEYDNVNEIIHLTVNPYYDDWSGLTPNITDIYFKYYSSKSSALSALSAGTVDILDKNYGVITADQSIGFDLAFADRPSLLEISINNEHPIIGTGESCPISSPESAKHVRRAISYLIDRADIVTNVLDGAGRAAATPWPYISIGYDSSLTPLEYNIELAKAEMELAGYSYEISIPTPTPTPTNNTTPSSPTVSIGLTFSSLIGAST